MAALNKSQRVRLLVVIIFLFVFLVGLIARVVFLIAVDGERLQKGAFLQQNKGTTVSPRRGTILDRNGKELAISVPVETITVSPNDIRKAKDNIDPVAQGLADILGLEKNAVLEKLLKNTNYQVIKEKVEKETVDQVREWAKKENIRIDFMEDFKRIYPFNSLAAHVIGITDWEGKGMMGIESTMERYLKGVPGKILSETDLAGRKISFKADKSISQQDGFNVVLTIDETIQYLAERALDKAIVDNDVQNGGVAIVMDPRNGDVLALVSKPDYNLNNPRECPPGEELDEWDGYSVEGVETLWQTTWRNKALMYTYEPGSTFKAITAAAALEEAIVTPDTIVDDTPVIIGSESIDCWKHPIHGEETFKEGVYNSCNPVFVKLSQQLGIERFYGYIRAFGFYENTGIELAGEQKSILHADPMEIDMAVTSFGQRFKITPMQLITSYTAIANGGYLMKPRLVKELRDLDGNIVQKFEPEIVRQVISRQTSDTMRDILEGVVSNGTGKKAYINGYRVAGKTGTAETLNSDVVDVSFSAFAPADNPVICVLMVLFDPKVEGRGGGSSAAPAVGKLIEETLTYLNVERRYSEEDIKSMAQEAYVPEVTGLSVDEAVAKLKGLSFDYLVEGDSDNRKATVEYQSPKYGERIPKKSMVILYTYRPEEEIKVKVPDLTNKTVGEATQALNSAGLNIRVSGLGTAVSQSIEEDTQVPKGTVVEVEFRGNDNIE